MKIGIPPICILLMLLAQPARATGGTLPAGGVAFFESKIRPVLADNCYGCHSGDAKVLKADFRLDFREGLLKGGKSGKPAIVPGEPQNSPLIAAIKRINPDTAMPPKEEHRLSPEQVADFEAWVQMGAPDPRDGTAQQLADPAAQAREHWAFQKPQEPAVPAVKTASWPKGPLDVFILAKLEEKNLTPAPPADKATLIRRATFDLHGLPPTPEEVDGFIADNGADAFAKVVDRLLASPRYGERWGRYWLDVARYADTKGYVFEEERRFPFAYAYRDWVIRAFNEDLPYDQFVIQQIAADRLPLGDDKRPLAAMGFLTVGRRFLNSQPDIIDDRIDVVTRGLMGLTVGCARCHDHKYDPIPIKDYYSLYGVFANSPEAKDPPELTAPAQTVEYQNYQKELQARQGNLDAFLKEKHEQLVPPLRSPKALADYMLAAQFSGTPDESIFMFGNDLNRFVQRRWTEFFERSRSTKEPVFSAWHAYAAIPSAEFEAKAAEVTQQLFSSPDPQRPINRLVAAEFTGKPPATMKEVAERYANLLARHDRAEPFPDADEEALRLVLLGPEGPPNIADEQIRRLLELDARQELNRRQMAVEQLKATDPGAPPRPMSLEDVPQPVNPRVFLRGNANTPGEEVPRQFLEIITGPERVPFQDGSGRLEMAQAIASKENPLTARVMVNRVWLHHFGAGLVTTPSDFGLRSDPPSHPELLDWLALRFVEQGWSMKQLHRLIMLSATYQQASTANPAYASVDPENRLLWRMNRRRLDFEAMRDSLIYVTGRLDQTVGGRSVELTTEPFTTRRTVYGFVERQNLPGLFRTFDFASPDTHSPQRFFTTVPQQALFMMNSPFAIHQTRQLAAREDVAKEPEPAKRIDRLYRLLFGRAPTEEEVALGVDFVSREVTQQPSASGWAYGFGQYDPGSQRVISFQPLPHFTGSAWQGGETLPDERLGWLVLQSQGGHPGQGADRAVIRRWTAPADGVLALDGQIHHDSPQGDGVQARIVSSRSGELASWAVHQSEAQTKLENLEVKAGDTIDFVVECRQNTSFDNFQWSPTIKLAHPALAAAAGTPGTTEWQAATDFAGPEGGPKLSPWEKYAQVLLQSNEFMFVD